MDKKKIEMAAEEYTAKHFLNDAEHLLKDPWPEARERYKKTLIRFATIALSHQWVSVEDALPEPHEEVLTYTVNAIDENAVAYYDGEDWYSIYGEHIRPHYWLPIPPLNPDDKLPTPTDL